MQSIDLLDNSGYFFNPVEPGKNAPMDYLAVVKNPICLKLIRDEAGMEQSIYSTDFERFESDVRRIYTNAMLYNPPGHPVHDTALQILLSVNESIFPVFVATQISGARKRCAKRVDKSRTLGLIRQLDKDDFLTTLLPSKSTLVVVPRNLIDHWRVQFVKHADVKYLSNGRGRGFVFEHTSSGKLSKASQAQILSETEKQSIFPFIFVGERAERGGGGVRKSHYKH